LIERMESAATDAWYAIWTRSHCERLVAQQLTAKGFRSFLPEIEIRSARRAAGQVPMFPGYLFVQAAMDKRHYIEMLQVRGVVRILEDGWTRLTPVPDAEIDAVQQVVDAKVPVFPHPQVREGDRVRVTEGPLAGLEGVFVQDRTSKGRFVVSIALLGRSVAVEMDRTALAPSSISAAA